MASRPETNMQRSTFRTGSGLPGLAWHSHGCFCHDPHPTTLTWGAPIFEAPIWRILQPCHLTEFPDWFRTGSSLSGLVGSRRMQRCLHTLFRTGSGLQETSHKNDTCVWTPNIVFVCQLWMANLSGRKAICLISMLAEASLGKWADDGKSWQAGF